jgi:sugar phosphate isomerase/epimerase
VAAALAAAADLHGVRLAVGADVRAGLRAPPFGTLLDPAALLATGIDPAAAATQAAGEVVAARVVDQLRSGLRGPIGSRGDGRLDVLAYRIALEASGFAGLPVIDARQWADPRGGVGQSVAAWTQAMPSFG